MSQTWNPDTYDENARFVSDLGLPVLEWLAPQAGERILDLGCGDGQLTAQIQAVGCEVIGVDASPEFVAAAQALGLQAHQMDGRQLTFDAEFNGVFSNAALHWMLPPEPVVAGVWRALKPAGRFVGEFGGHGNVAAIKTALYQVLRQRGVDASCLEPWFFPTVAEYGEMLRAHGFTVLRIELIPRPTPLPTGMRGWLETFANPFTLALPPDERASFLDEVTNALQPSLCDRTGHWTADYVRLRFIAIKPQS